MPNPTVTSKEEEEGAVAYYAAGEGGVSHEEETREVRGLVRRRLEIGVTPTSRIEQDVDYFTGNVDFNGDVVIDGSVRALFAVKATGSVTIGGSIESGARIEAGGDIVVSGGVVGDSTELVSGGSVMAMFLQKTNVRAQGNVQIGAYIFERCGAGGK